MSSCPTEIAAQHLWPRSDLALASSLQSIFREFSLLATHRLFMDDKKKRLAGRPVMKSGKRSKKIEARFTEEEFNAIVAMEKKYGISRTDLVRLKLLSSSGHLIVNAGALLLPLDAIGAELGRNGNNINQLAKYANTLAKRGMLSPQIIERFNVLLAAHGLIQQKLEVSLRKIIRSMGH
ncbi:plasmid mobilization protein [Pedobacter sp. GR22-6]|uniref:plasmid mobilization protein n=1 Tax=Pedobacter sp. GR22-6 TaxID=3127957 RepID=UPI00307EB303